jgi:hypothetical protein
MYEQQTAEALRSRRCILWLILVVGLNIREVKADTCLPTGGGADGQQPVAVLKGEQVCTYGQRPTNSGGEDEQALTNFAKHLR